MAAASKLLPPEIAKMECSQLIHPWTKSCAYAALNMYIYSCVGSSGYFAILYLFQYLVKAVKKKNRPMLKDLLKTYVRSCLLFASVVASCYIALSCTFRNFLGRYYYYTVVLIPATLAGLAVSAETPRNQDFFSTAFANFALESFIGKIKGEGTVKWSENKQTLAFMVLTCLLSHLYKQTENENKLFCLYLNFSSSTLQRSEQKWMVQTGMKQFLSFRFFVPPKIDTDEARSTSCFHGGTCYKNISSNFFKYFTTGFLLKLLKLLFSHFKEPKKIFSSLFKPKTYSFASFLGFYAAVYQSTRCFFYRKFRKYAPVHDLMSGFLSGVTYKFEPNIPIFNSAAITIFQILIDIGCKKNVLPDLPYNVLLFAISCGVLFHSRLFTPKQCPSIMHYIMSSVTNRKSDILCRHYHNLLEQL